jgi:hypothetical protein
MMKYIWFFSLLALAGCSKKLISGFIDPDSIPTGPRSVLSNKQTFTQTDPGAYIPDTLHLNHTPIRFLRVNFHFMNSSDSSRNFSEARSRVFVRDLLHVMQILFDTNIKLWLPPDNDIPVIPVNIKYVLTGSGPGDDGIYHHYDDQLYYYIHMGPRRNNYDGEVIDKYAIGLDSVLNIFIMPHHPDSAKSKTYKSGCVGIALGNAIKISGIFENQLSEWNVRGTFNHEVGHVLGLYHAWMSDGCEDTPLHPNNCWVIEEPGCSGRTSNNMMDYNAWQSALSPCQVGIMHKNLANSFNPVRNLLIKNWCRYIRDNKIIIRDTVEWNGAHDLESDLEILPGASLTIHGRVSMPPGSRITIHPGADLFLEDCILHNDCGQNWQGIEILKKGKKSGRVSKSGKVEIKNCPPNF